MKRKYFIAVVIPEPFYERIEALKQALLDDYGLKGALRSPAHITLHRPFEWKEEKEQLLIEKLEQFRFDQSVSIQLKDFDFFEPRVIYVNVVPNPQLVLLHGALKLYAKRELQLFNEWEDLRGFHPHITVANRDLKKPQFYKLQPEFARRQFEGAFAYGGFSLLRLEKTWEVLKTFNSM